MSDQVAVITGANGGLGFQTAVALARMGTRVVMACRSVDKGEQAREELSAVVPGNEAIVLRLDVSEPESVREFRRQLEERVGGLDVLINNAGVVLVPLERNSAGHELHLATNFLGAFALTGTLLPLFRVRAGSAARIVNVGSLANRFVGLDLNDLNWERSTYGEWKAYARSKVALLTYTLELDRRLRAAGSPVIALGAHPGMANTNAGRGTEALEPKSAFGQWLTHNVVEPLIPKASDASRPIVHAATADGVEGGDYYGPADLLETRGKPGRARINRRAKDPDVARRLWELAEELTGVEYHFDRIGSALG